MVTSNSKQRIANLEADCQLYANLFVAYQARNNDLDNFFLHENHAYPVSLSEYGKLRKCSAKSSFQQCLNDIATPSLLPPNVEVKIIDAAVFVNINKKNIGNTWAVLFGGNLYLIPIKRTVS